MSWWLLWRCCAEQGPSMPAMPFKLCSLCKSTQLLLYWVLLWLSAGTRSMHHDRYDFCSYNWQYQGMVVPYSSWLYVTADASTGNRKTGASAKSHGLSPTALKSVIFGATTTLVVLVLILVTLVVYYVYHQYESQHKPQNSKSRTPKDIVYSPAACEQLNGSEHSSQQELMDSDEEASSQGKTSLISTAGYQYKPAECSTETVWCRHYCNSLSAVPHIHIVR